MKVLKIIITSTILLILNSSVKAQTIDTLSFGVEGVCGMCKERIENAAKIKGVKSAEWDKQKQELQLIYIAEKTNIQKVHKSLASIGHSTSEIKAPEKAYKYLPNCCKYKEVEVH